MNQFLEYLKFNYKNTSHSEIERLLQKEGICIGRLIQQETFVNMYKQSSFKATQLMTYEKIETLVEYLTVEGPPNDTKRSYKYPLLACEILSSDNTSTIDYFFSNGPVIVEESVYRKTSFAKEHEDQEEDDQLNSQSSLSSASSVSEEQSDQYSSKSSVSSLSRSRKSSVDSSEESQKEIANHTHHHREKYRFISPLIDKLFHFFQGTLNYTLAGYICQVLTTFLKQKPIVVMEYILENDKIQLLLNHIQSRSVGDFLANVLIYDIEDLVPERKEAFDLLIQKITVASDIHIISNVSPVIREIIQKLSTNPPKQCETLCQQFFCLQNFKKLLQNSISSDQTVVSYCPGVLYQYACQILCKKPIPEEFTKYLKKYLYTFFSKSIDIFRNIHSSNTKIGMGRIRLLETIALFIEKDVAGSQDIAAGVPQFFSTFLQLFKQHPLSNILHNQLLKFFKFVISRPPTNPLQSTLLEGTYFKDFLVNGITQAKTGKKKAIGYTAHLIEISKSIPEHSTNNSALMAIIFDSEFSEMYSDYIDQSIINIQKSLGGFIKRQNQSNIEFSTEAILHKYQNFLEASPCPIYELKQTSPNSRFDYSPTSNKHSNFNKKCIRAKSNNRAALDFQAEEENADQDYWSKHLEYDADQLMDDL